MKSGKLLVEKLGCQIFDLVRWLPSATIQRMDHLAQPEISTVVQAGRHSGSTMTETMTTIGSSMVAMLVTQNGAG